jgi:N-sulfoglucosamine sulfohydrolase
VTCVRSGIPSALLLLAAYAAAPAAALAERPNFLFILSDDQRADTIGAWGNPHIRTPSLDRLAERGFGFRANYCFGGSSGAVCIPSRAMIHSGRTWFRVAHDLAGAKLLPELLREHGWTTFATGKWHNGEASFRRGFERGKAIFFGGMSDHGAVPLKDLLPDGGLSPERTGEGFSSELFADAAVEFLEGASPEKPFFAYVAFTAPHDPRQPPAAHREPYAARPPPLPASFLPQHPFDNGQLAVRDEELAPWPRTPGVVREQLADYYAMISHLDEQAGRVVAALERSPHAGRTFVVFASDHGLALGSHGLLGKQNVYEHSMRAPLIIAGPGIPKGATDAFTYLFDLFPTICGLAGVALPEGLDGLDLAPLWRAEKASLRESVFLPYLDLMRAVRDRRWKLIRYPKIDHTQLFDLEEDSDELRDLSSDPRRGGELERLLALLRASQEEFGDRLPLRVEAPRPKAIDLSGRRREPDRWQPAEIRTRYFGEEADARAVRRPNIVLAIADDWGWPHAGAYGDRVVRTPVFDRLAREGVLFERAFASSPSCTPSRGAIITGQHFFRLGEAANLWSRWPEGRHPEYPRLLAAAGYHTGSYRKGWGPGEGQPAGKRYPSLAAFFEARPEGAPFCLWFGSSDPHRPYEAGAGAARGMKLEDVHLFGHLPDAPEVRSDVADYYFEVERFDRELGELLALLERRGELEDTLVIATGDHGMPFPRAKANVYDAGARVPLAVRWGRRVPGGRRITDLVSLTDLAPAFLEAARLPVPPEMTGRSLIALLTGNRSGRIEAERGQVIIGKERHVPAQEEPERGGYPIRALRAEDFLYIRNLRPERWPAGTPHHERAAIRGAWLADCDNGPTKRFIWDRRDDPAVKRAYELAFGRRPPEELYDLRRDPDQLENLAADPRYATVREELAARLARALEAAADPRSSAAGDDLDRPPYLGGAPRWGE